MATAHPFDGLVLIPNCDKIVPGMLMRPASEHSGHCRERRSHARGTWEGKAADLITIFEGVGKGQGRQDERAGPARPGRLRLPGLRFLRGHVHGELHELPDRGDRFGSPRQRYHPGRPRRPAATRQAGGHADHGPVKKDVRPRDIATPAAFANAIAVDMALGCSTNTVPTCPPSPTRRGSPWTSICSTRSAGRFPTSAPSAPRERTASKISIGPVASRRS
jgi:dihydroxy-acid dehydratase